MRSSKPLRLAVLITLIVLIVAANTLTVLFALRRGETGAAQSTDAPAVKQTENAPQITASTVQPQKIILRRGSETLSVSKGSEDYKAILQLNEKRKNGIHYCTEMGNFETISGENDIELIYEFEKETPYILPLQYEHPEKNVTEVYFVLTGENHTWFATKPENGYACYAGIGSNTDLIRICKELLDTPSKTDSAA